MTLLDINKNLLSVCSYQFLDTIKINCLRDNAPSGDVKVLLDNDEQMIIKYLSIVDSASLSINPENKELIFSATCLLYELFNSVFPNIEGYIRTIFLRLGFPPSALTVQADKSKFNDLPNFFDEIEQGLNLTNNHEIEITNKTYYLTKEQKKIWEELLGAKKEVLISAPTSAGKSFLLAEYIVIGYQNSDMYRAVYTVPTLSLINQVEHDLKSIDQSINILTHIPKQMPDGKVVFVLTQERTMGICSQYADINWDCVVLDEVHNIFSDLTISSEDTDDEDTNIDNEDTNKDALNDRSLVYRFILEWFADKINYQKLILAGPNITQGISEIKKTSFDIDTSIEVPVQDAPVLKILFSFELRPSDKTIFHANLLLKNNPVSTNIILSKNLKSNIGVHAISSEFCIDLRQNIISKDPNTTILSLCPSPSKASNVVAKGKNNDIIPIEENTTFLKTYFRSILKCTEEELVEFGFDINHKSVIHHGKLPSHIRLCIEIAAKNNLINSLVTTSTLLQGMNFPIKYLIATDGGNISLDRTSDKRKPFSIPQFKNILGRSGRLMQDLVGYGIILDVGQLKEDLSIEGDETIGEALSHEEGEQGLDDLKNSADAIVLASMNTPVADDDKPYRVKQKACLIRRYVLMYSNFAKCKKLLHNRGIELTEKNHTDIKNILPRTPFIIELILKQHHLFDPLDMEKMIRIYTALPSLKNTTINNIYNYIIAVWNISTDNFHHHTRHYVFNSINIGRSSIDSYAKLATDWAHEKKWTELWGDSIGYFDTTASPSSWISCTVTEFIQEENRKKQESKEKNQQEKNRGETLSSSYSPTKVSTKLKNFGAKIEVITFHLPRLLKPWLDIDEHFKKTIDSDYAGSPILGAIEHGLTGDTHKTRLEKGYHRELILDWGNSNLWVQKQKDFLDGKNFSE